MHAANRVFWNRCVQRYPKYFLNVGKVLEVGSYNVNGSVKDHFSNTTVYVGVDWRAGPGVDIVSFAHEMEFDFMFDTIISASMLEHDPHWEKSLVKMIEFLDDDGALFLSWGSALNAEHELDTACDGGFHALPAGKVIRLLEERGLTVHEFIYEAQIPNAKMELPSSGWGEVCLVAFKNVSNTSSPASVADLLKEDDV